MGKIEKALAAAPYVVGERFTAADILYMGLFDRARGLLGKRDAIDAYIARGIDRPARQSAVHRGG